MKYCKKGDEEILIGYKRIEDELGCKFGDGTRCQQLAPVLLFFAQAGYQHTKAYTIHYGVQDIALSMNKAKKGLGISNTKSSIEQKMMLFNGILEYIKSLK